MICPACKYDSNADDTCPECGRLFSVSRSLVESRRRFAKIWFACHLLWYLGALAYAVLLLFPGNDNGLGRLFGIIYLAIGMIVLAAEAVAAYLILYKFDASNLARYAWCFMVGGLSVLIVLSWMWTQFLYQFFL